MGENSPKQTQLSTNCLTVLSKSMNFAVLKEELGSTKTLYHLIKCYSPDLKFCKTMASIQTIVINSDL